MKDKDPAFLMYSKDWIEGTMELLPEEKGVYIDLLCHHHQKGSLPTDPKRLAKLVGLGEQEFLFIWEGIKEKFFVENSRLYNRKLTKIITERSEKGEKNKIIGTLAAVFRLSDAPYELKIKAKKDFNYATFKGFTNQSLTDAVTEWFNSRLKSIANENANEDVFKDSSLGGTGDFSSIELNNVTLEAAEMNQFTHHKNKHTDFIKSQWKIFLLERSNDPLVKQRDYLKYHAKLYSHFLNWIRDKKPQINGTYQQTPNGSQQAGSKSEGRIEAYKRTGLANRKSDS